MTTASQRAQTWVETYERCTNAGDINGATALFDDAECFWRDLVFFSWNLKTTEGKQEIAEMLKAICPMQAK